MRSFIGTLLAGIVFSTAVSAAELRLTEFDEDRAYILHRGDTLLISLPSNRTTGYGWDYLFSIAGLLRQDGEMDYHQAKRGKGMVGVGGTEIWKFMAVKKGETSLCFSYLRPWERSIAPVKTKTWKITVQ
jgi:inhibitor of cysteine peptidase